MASQDAPSSQSISEKVEHDQEQAESGSRTDSSKDVEKEYPTGWRLLLVVIAVLMGMFLSALDMTIIATAIPYITDEFRSVDQIGWYGSGFFITLAAFQATWGKAYKYFTLKATFLSCILLFEVGNLICGVARSSTVLIIGRAIAGVGSAGGLSGSYIIIAHIVPPKRHPLYVGLIGMIYSIASVAGPLIGGVLTERISWRWCFYINLPLGGATGALLVLFFKNPDIERPQVSWIEVLRQMDVPGTLTITAALVMYTLAMQWGGTTKAWSSPDVIGVLVGFVLATIAFLILEWAQGERSLLIFRIIGQRHVASLCAYVFFLNAATFQLLYYFPVYFQAVRNSSPATSGVENLPLILALSLCIPIGTTIVSLTGRFHVLLLAGAVLTTVGAGLIYTLDIGSSTGKYVGYQIIFGVGEGIAVQMPMIASQFFAKAEDLSPTTGTVMFFQVGSGALGVSAAQAIFQNRLLESASHLVPQLPRSGILAVGASDLRSAFGPDTLPGVVRSYMTGIKAAWACSLALAGVTFIISFLPRWTSIKR